MGVMPNISPLLVQMTPTAGVITLTLVLGANLGVVISALQHPQKCSAGPRKKSKKNARSAARHNPVLWGKANPESRKTCASMAYCATTIAEPSTRTLCTNNNQRRKEEENKNNDNIGTLHLDSHPTQYNIKVILLRL